MELKHKYSFHTLVLNLPLIFSVLLFSGPRGTENSNFHLHTRTELLKKTRSISTFNLFSSLSKKLIADPGFIVCIILLRAFGAGISGIIFPSHREKYMDNQIKKIEQVDKKEDENEDDLEKR